MRPVPAERPAAIGSEAEEAAGEDWLPPVRERVLPEQVELRLAVWNMISGTGGAAAPVPVVTPEPKRVWRHTFGAERETASWRQLVSAAGFEADVMALQGARSLHDLRQLFPVRRYHAVVSRQLLARSTASSGGLPVFRDDAPATTAVVYRKQRRVRSAGFKHFLPERVSRAGRGAIAITAMRLRVFRRTVWVVSIDGRLCGSDKAVTCPEQDELLARFVVWSDQIIDHRSAVVVAGRWPQALGGAFSNTIEQQRIAARSSPCRPESSGVMLLTRPQGSDSGDAVLFQVKSETSAVDGSEPKSGDDKRAAEFSSGAQCASFYRLTIRP